jgi:hypothetical protein
MGLLYLFSMLHELKRLGQELVIEQITTYFVDDLLTLIANQKDNHLLCRGMFEEDGLTYEKKNFIISLN